MVLYLLFLYLSSLMTLDCEISRVKLANNSVLMVCYNNYIRSPIAAAVFNEIVRRRGIDSRWYCDSAGISVNQEFDMDLRAKETLRSHGIEPYNTPKEVIVDDFFKFDFIFGMDRIIIGQLRTKKPVGSRTKIELLTTYDPESKHMIRDPYFDEDSAGFEECYQIAYRSFNAFLEEFQKSEA